MTRARRRTRLRGSGGVLLLVAGIQIAAATAAFAKQDPAVVADAIRRAVMATAPANATITLGPVMGAQFMPACTGGLSVAITGNEPYQEAAVHCGAPPWTLYVTVTVDARMAVVVAARPIAAGQTVQAGDLALREEPISLYAGRQVYYHADDILGSLATMSLSAGTIVTNTDVQQPEIVQAGQTITVHVHSGGVELSIDGTADKSGRVGDSILVTNPSSGKQFTALVTRSGAEVQLDP